MEMTQSEYRYRRLAAGVVRRAIRDAIDDTDHAADALRWMHGRGTEGTGTNNRLLDFDTACQLAGVSPERVRSYVKNNL
jgi:hypothetical protein